MLVGTKIIPLHELRDAATSVTALLVFSEQLVPKPLRHISAIVDNQRYLVAVTLRNIKAIPYKRRIELCEGLIRGVSVTGVVNIVHDFEDILSEVDTELLYKYIFGKE